MIHGSGYKNGILCTNASNVTIDRSSVKTHNCPWPQQLELMQQLGHLDPPNGINGSTLGTPGQTSKDGNSSYWLRQREALINEVFGDGNRGLLPSKNVPDR